MVFSLPRSLMPVGSTPFLGALLLSALLVFSPLFEGGTTHLAVMTMRLLTLLLLSLYLWTELSEERLWMPPTPAVRAIARPVLVFLAIGCVSVARSPYSHQSLQWLVVLVGYAVLLHLVVFFVHEWKHVTRLLKIVVGIGLLETVVALVQGWHGRIRPPGTFFNPNFLAGYLACAWAVVLAQWCYARFDQRIQQPGSRRWARLSIKLVPLAMLAFLLGGILWTESRGGLLALGGGSAIVLGIRYGGSKRSLLIGLACLAAVLLGLGYGFRPQHGALQLEYARWQIWQSSLRAMLEHPFGMGLGLYQYIYPPYAVPVEGMITRYGKVAHVAHNEYLQIGVELGIAGLLTFLWGIGLMTREVVYTLRKRMFRWQRGVTVGMVGALASILIHAMVDSNLHEPAIAILLVVLGGGILSIRYRLASAEESACRVVVRSPLIWKTLSVVVIGLLAVNVVRWGVAWTSYAVGARAHESRNNEQAIAEFVRSVRFDPGKALYHSALGAAYFDEFGRHRDRAIANKALAELHAAIALNPLDGRLHVVLGQVYGVLAASLSTQSSQAAERDALLQASLASYERSVQLEPFIASRHLEIGRLYGWLGDKGKAEAAVEHAVSIEPNFLPAREWLARRYLETNRREQAKREYEEILARQHRYAYLSKDDLEASFLTADVGSLAAALDKDSGA